MKIKKEGLTKPSFLIMVGGYSTFNFRYSEGV